MTVWIIAAAALIALCALALPALVTRPPRAADAQRLRLSAPRLSPQELTAQLTRLGLQVQPHGQRRLRLARKSTRRFFMLLRSSLLPSHGREPGVPWLRDNSRMLEEQLRRLQGELRSLPPLPALRGGGLRISALTDTLCLSLGGEVDPGALPELLACWQRSAGMTEQELQALPAALRRTLLLLLTDAAADLRTARLERDRGQRLARALRHNALSDHLLATLSPEALDGLTQALEAKGAGEALHTLDLLLTQAGQDTAALARQAREREMARGHWVAALCASLRALDRVSWPEFLEDLSLLHHCFLQDPAQVYSRMDFDSRRMYVLRTARLARLMGMTEERVALGALHLAQEAAEDGAADHIGTYLLTDEGLQALYASLRLRRSLRFPLALFFRRHGRGLYLTLLWLGVAAGLAAGAALSLPALLIPAWLLVFSHAWRVLLGRVLPRLYPARELPRLHLPQLEERQRTLLVLPVLLSDPEQAIRMIGRLSELRHADPDTFFDYMLLGDFGDSLTAEEVADGLIIRAASSALEALQADDPDHTYLYLQRRRAYDRGERAWIGRERKRGSLESLNRLIVEGTCEDSYDYASMELSRLHRRYAFVLTLDQDTVLLPDEAHSLVGTLSHPLAQRRETAAGWVGVSIVQPRMEIDPAALRTPLNRLLAGHAGTDLYHAVSCPLYQRLCGRGSYQGKGIYDPAALLAATSGWILPDTVLSHDLLEGELAGCAADSSLTLLEGQPAVWSAWLRRLHRWTRGDWQLLRWLLPWVQTPAGVRRNPLSRFSRHKVWDALRLSLLPLGHAALLLCSALSARPGLFLLTLALMLAEGLLAPRHADWRGLFTRLCALPTLVAVQADAALRALWRSLISHEKRLNWLPAAQTEWTQAGELFVTPWTQWLGALALGGCALLARPPQLAPLPLAALFAIQPLLLPRLEAPRRASPPLMPEQQEQLHTLAERTWRFFQNNVTEATHFLPPDNVQLDPPRGAAMRTSPTNIGLYLLSTAAAMELGLLEADEAARRLLATVDTLEHLPTWRGHLYNWLDLTTLAPMEPHYVSSVDSGNYVACLLATAQLFRQRLAALDASCRELPARLDALAYAVDLSAVYDPAAQLFFIGGDPRKGAISGNHYDLLASEARLLSFVAICTGQTPLRHFSRLSRACVPCGRSRPLLSWSGSLFEYLMPTLLLPTWPGTLLHTACLDAIRCQLRAGRDGLWAISESGYYAFDPQLHYQYCAFGLPALAADPNAQGQVYAPYAAALALPFAPDAALSMLHRLEALGLFAPEGFLESLDCCPERTTDQPCQAVRSHMAHHQGMLFCAVVNALTDASLVRAFCRLPAVRAFLPLLKERAAPSPLTLTLPRPRPEAMAKAPLPATALSPLALPVEAVLLGGGEAYVLQSASGLGVLGVGDVLLSRFTRDPSRREGVFFYLLEQGRMWQPFDPRFPGEVTYTDGVCVLTRTHRELRMTLRTLVDPVSQHILHALTLENLSTRDRALEVADYFELALTPEMEQLAHPTYNDLFIETAPFGEMGLTAVRHARSPEECPVRLYHLLAQPAEAAVFAETDRCAFLGRNGSPWQPQALRQAAHQGVFGTPVHPCAALRCQVTLHGLGRIQLVFVTHCTREEALLPPDALTLDSPKLAQCLDMARLRQQVLLDSLGIPAAELPLLTHMTGAVQWLHQPHQGVSSPVALPREALHELGLTDEFPLLTVLLSREDSALRTLALHFAALQRSQGMPVLLALVALEDTQGSVYAAAKAALASSPLRDQLGHGAALLCRGELTPQQGALLHAASSLSLDERLGPMQAQLDSLRQVLTPTPMVPPPLAAALVPEPALVLPNGFGGFLPDGSGYQIDLPVGLETPAPWCNYLHQPSFGTLCSESGLLFTHGDNSYLHRLTPWVNDPVTPLGGEYVLLEDCATGRFLSPTRLPLGQRLACHVMHTPGVTTYAAENELLSLQWVCFTDAEADAGCRQLRVRSRGDAPLRLRLHVCMRFVLGTDRRAESFTCVTPLPGLALAVNPAWPVLAFAAPLNEGVEINRLSPSALQGLWGMEPWGLHPPAERGPQDAEPALRGATDRGNIAVLTQEITLAPGGSASFAYLTGIARQPEDIEQLLTAYRQAGVSARLRAVQSYWSAELSRLTCHVPEEGLSLMLNLCLPYQVRTARLWSRAGLYQAGGAIGFRDQLQDMTALIYTHPEEVRRHLLLCASRQYEAGDVQHWWHPGGAGVRTRITDDRLFLPFLTAWYITRTGDTDILAADVPFLLGADIPEEQSDLYHTAAPTAYAAPLMEHCLRAIRSLPLGPRGIPLMQGGDWNDGMNRVGGESVFLGFLLCRVLRDFAPLCTAEDAAPLLRLRQSVLNALETHAWDGAWYMRAWYPDGRVLGSRESPACRIDLLSQCWAVLGGALRERAVQALQSALGQLHAPELGLTALLAPPFTPEVDAGYISGYAPGVRENGGQYTHAVAWLLWALAELGEYELAWALVSEALPLGHSDTPEHALRYRLEPYFTAADIYTAPGQEGRGGWSAYTGSAAWLYTVILEQLLGLQKQGAHIALRPHVPAAWEGFALTLHVGASTWHLQARRDLTYVTLDGEKAEDGLVALFDDGRIHEASFPLRN